MSRGHPCTARVQRIAYTVRMQRIACAVHILCACPNRKSTSLRSTVTKASLISRVFSRPRCSKWYFMSVASTIET